MQAGSDLSGGLGLELLLLELDFINPPGACISCIYDFLKKRTLWVFNYMKGGTVRSDSHLRIFFCCGAHECRLQAMIADKDFS